MVVILLCVVAIIMMVVDSNSSVMKKPRSFLMNFSTPVYWIADIPNKLTRLNADLFSNRKDLAQKNKALEARLLILQGKLQKMAQITTENRRLRQLLKSSVILQENILVAEVIGVSPSRHDHFLVLNKGKDDGVYIGQSVLDAEGLLGQIIEVNADSSRVLLLTDGSHAVPVQDNRSGVRGIVEGDGNYLELEMTQVPVTADIREGDLLVSSGLAGRFPSGYPVARVTQVDKTQDQFFAAIKTKPLARINNSRFVLLVFSKVDPDLQELLLED